MYCFAIICYYSLSSFALVISKYSEDVIIVLFSLTLLVKVRKLVTVFVQSMLSFSVSSIMACSAV